MDRKRTSERATRAHQRGVIMNHTPKRLMTVGTLSGALLLSIVAGISAQEEGKDRWHRFPARRRSVCRTA